MLVLSRNIGERIMIGEDVVITIADIKKNKVRLGFEAPNECIIDREEVFNRKKANGVRPWKENP